ncbi:hypothetical protein [Streptomyces adustus]
MGFTPRHRPGPFTDAVLTRCEEITLAAYCGGAPPAIIKEYIDNQRYPG